jgi:hypothetical protein
LRIREPSVASSSVRDVPSPSHPTVDVMAAGGWKDHKTLETAYQQADEATMFAVMNEPRKLREAK